MKFDVIVIGGGRTGFEAAMDAVRAGRSCAMIAFGRSTHTVEYGPFSQAGGTLLMGDKAVSAEMEPASDGMRVTSVHTLNLGDTPLVAEEYVYAPGKFFGGGLVADMNNVYEPLFGLDVEYEKDHSKWFDEDFNKDQPFMDFGVVTDSEGHPMAKGKKIVNVIAKGEIKCRKKA